MYGIVHSFTDTTSDSGTYWSFPEDHDYTWIEAIGIVMAEAERACHAAAVMVVEGGMTPCQLGCMEDDGTLIPDGECGEPGTHTFRVSVRDDESIQTWGVC